MLQIHNITVSGRRTSIRLEPEMWDGMAEICRREGRTIHQICSLIEKGGRGSSFTARLRVFIMNYFRAAATEEGHAEAGHGNGASSRLSWRRSRRPRGFGKIARRGVANRRLGAVAASRPS